MVRSHNQDTLVPNVNSLLYLLEPVLWSYLWVKVLVLADNTLTSVFQELLLVNEFLVCLIVEIKKRYIVLIEDIVTVCTHDAIVIIPSRS